MKIYLVNIIWCLLLFPIGLQAQTIEDYLKTASENNPQLKSSYSTFEASLKRVSQVNALPDPTISFGYFMSPVETRVGSQRAKLSLSQMFPWFGLLRAKEDVATLKAEAKYNEFLNDKNELFYDVKRAYYPIYEINKHIRLKREYLAILETYKKLATTSVSNGKASMIDVIRVDIMIDDMKTDLRLLEDKLKPYTVSFNRLLNRPDSTTVVVSDSLSSMVVENSYRKDSLLGSNPVLKVIDSKINATNSMMEVAKKSGYPKFGLGLDYAFIGERTDMNVADNGRDAFMPMFSMSLPIFRGKYKASVEEVELIRTSLKFEKVSVVNTLFAKYEMAWFELEKAHQLIILYNNQMVKTKRVVDLLYVAYGNSGNDFEEVLRMQQQLLKYQIALASSSARFHIALAHLDYITAKSE